MGRIVSSRDIVGEIKVHGSNTAPNGFLMCNGQAVSRTTYAALFAAIGTTWGIGDGSTTFNVPDMRGRTLRGRDGGAGNDPDAGTRTAINGGASGDNVGSLQGDQYASHNHGGGSHAHGVTDAGHVHGVTDTGHTHDTTLAVNGAAGTSTETWPATMYDPPLTYSSTGTNTSTETTGISVNNATTGISVNTSGTIINSNGGSETRMKNVNVLFIIRY